MVELNLELLAIILKILLVLLALVVVAAFGGLILWLWVWFSFAFSPFILIGGVVNFITPGQEVYGLWMIGYALISATLGFLFVVNYSGPTL